jgi:hypothetical protein
VTRQSLFDTLSMDRLLAAPCLTRSSKNARIGATPVPGPTRMTGVDASGGRWSVGGDILIGNLVPIEVRSKRRVRLAYWQTL